MKLLLPHQVVEHKVRSDFDRDIRARFFRGLDFAGPQGDPGWFGPGSAVWKVHSHTTALIFGLQCAAFMERLDPSIFWMGTDHSRVVERDEDGNPTGRFEVGGPMGDAGLTGRKIIVDTYGGMARHGGGAFSGKDPSKVDRSATYAMRWVAKNVVAAGLADRCEVQVAYAIGKAHPVGVFVQTFGTGVLPDERIQEAVLEVFDLRPAAIIRDLDLLRPIYRPTAAYGHFGRELPDFTWERTDRADALKSAAGA